MVLHEGKFEYLCYRAGNCKLLEELPFTNSYNFDYQTPAGFSLKPKASVRDLGITLDSNYHWSVHINQMAAGARKLAAWALGVFRDRSILVMLTIWKSLIRCKLEYCCPLWNPQKLEDIKALEQPFSICGTRTTGGTRAPSTGTRSMNDFFEAIF